MKIKRMKELIEILNNARRIYYQENNESMSNFDYDKLYDELVDLENETKIIYPSSPTKEVGFEILSSLEKVRHEEKILSLDKTKEISELEKFIEDKEGILSWKLDGLTIVLKYINGNLFQAITRGNGEIGEDVTHNAKVFKNIPTKINFLGNLTIRGEALIGNKEFEKINSLIGNNEEKYKNPRNLSSGTIRQLNNEVVENRNIEFFGFSIINNIDKDFNNLKSNQLNWLKELGFDTVYFEIVNKENIHNTVEKFEKNISKNDFGSDGLVLTFDEINFSKSLGVTSKFPKDSLAFKWKDETAETILIKIDWNTSRTGLINPIGVFEPVQLEGTTVNKASLHNVSILENLQIGIGDTIEVYKANMIIPQILDNLTRSNNLDIPKKCPVCGEETILVEENQVKFLYCKNLKCSAQIISGLKHFTSRDGMNIEGLSKATLKKLVDIGLIKNYLDIYNLKNHEEIKKLEGFGEKSFTKLIANIEKSKNVNLANFIYALGISQVGLSNANLLSEHFNNNINEILKATEEQLITIEGYGEIIVKSILDYFENKENLNLVNKILEIINLNKIETVFNENKTLEGKNFVITGSVEKFKNRKELENLIKNLGGKSSSSVSKNTNYLINNNINSASSKNKEAKNLNIPIITEEEFINVFKIKN